MREHTAGNPAKFAAQAAVDRCLEAGFSIDPDTFTPGDWIDVADLGKLGLGGDACLALGLLRAQADQAFGAAELGEDFLLRW